MMTKWVQMEATLGFGPFKMHKQTSNSQTPSAGFGKPHPDRRLEVAITGVVIYEELC
jgi:hypothetical protein